LQTNCLPHFTSSDTGGGVFNTRLAPFHSSESIAEDKGLSLTALLPPVFLKGLKNEY